MNQDNYIRWAIAAIAAAILVEVSLNFFRTPAEGAPLDWSTHQHKALTLAYRAKDVPAVHESYRVVEARQDCYWAQGLYADEFRLCVRDYQKGGKPCQRWLVQK